MASRESCFATRRPAGCAFRLGEHALTILFARGLHHRVVAKSDERRERSGFAPLLGVWRKLHGISDLGKELQQSSAGMPVNDACGYRRASSPARISI